MIMVDINQHEDRKQLCITSTVLLPEPVWTEIEIISKHHKFKLIHLIDQIVYWVSAPYRATPDLINNLELIEMPGHSGDGQRPFDISLTDSVYFEIEDLSRIIRVKPSELMTQFLIHSVFDGPLSETLRALTGEDRVRRQAEWKPALRQAMQGKAKQCDGTGTLHSQPSLVITPGEGDGGRSVAPAASIQPS